MIEFLTCRPEVRFDDLTNAVQYCDLCPRMNHRIKVLSKLNGNIHSNILFIAEAPGRLGADKTGIPLYGDKTGDNFEYLISSIGLKREDIFITNALLCNPRKEDGNNGSPKKEEILNCSYYLRMTIEVIKPEFIIALGKVALDSLNLIHPHNLKLKQNVAEMHSWRNYNLIPLYHPGPRAVIHRPIKKQKEDFIKLLQYVEHRIIKEEVKQLAPWQTHLEKYKTEFTKFEKVIFSIIDRYSEISLFKLTKLLYLIDFNAITLYGHSLTNEIYLRQKDGPWLPNLIKTIDKFGDSYFEKQFKSNQLFLEQKNRPSYIIDWLPEESELFDSILKKYGHLKNSDLKTKVYLTQPMRFILSEEKKGKKMVNSAVIYKDKTIIDKVENHLELEF